MDGLTARQKDVAERVHYGLSDQQIARDLKISERRVRQLIARIACAWKVDRTKNARVQIATRWTPA